MNVNNICIVSSLYFYILLTQSMQLLRHHAEPLCASVGVAPPGPVLAAAEAVVPARGVAVVVRLEDAVIGGEVTVRLARGPGQVLGLFMGVRPHVFTWSWKHISQIMRGSSVILHPTFHSQVR